jgi:hypothetical protein
MKKAIEFISDALFFLGGSIAVLTILAAAKG